MRFATIFNYALVVALFAPSALAQAIDSDAHGIYSRESAHGTAMKARQLESFVNNMIQERVLAGEDRAVLEARFFPILGGLRMLGKGVKVAKGLASARKKKNN